MQIGPTIHEGIRLAHRRLRSIWIDLVWRTIWVVAIGLLKFAILFWFARELASIELGGPVLALLGPMMKPVILLGFLQAHSGTVAAAFLGITIAAILLWIVLEAYFRGGPQDFWIFAAASAARLSILATVAALMGLLVALDEGGWTIVPAAVVWCGVAFLTVTAETLVRRNAVELLGTDLPGVCLTVGLSIVLEAVILALCLTLGAAAVLLSSRTIELAAAVLISFAALGLWSVAHSYLLLVRFSTVDIMRRNVVDA